MIGRRRCAAILAVLVGAPAAGADWPPIPDAERRLDQVAGFPEAPAVVLYERGSLDVSGKTLSSHLDVYRRVKVLSPQGKAYGTVALFSSRYHRMTDLEARVHLPGGAVLPLPPEATFEKGYSGVYDRSIVSFALPQVEPGAIVEYRYRVSFDAVLYPEPWYFQDAIPTLRSEVSCSVPRDATFRPHVVRTVDREVAEEVTAGARGTTFTLSAADLPPVPDEPGAMPFGELATRVTFLPVASGEGTRRVPLLESWDSVARILEGDRQGGYAFTRARAAAARARAEELTAGQDAAAAATTLCRFVRDTIATAPFSGAALARTGADEVLAARQGNAVEKALLLQVMLEAVRLPSSLGLTARRSTGRVDEALTSPGQFDAALVAVDVAGRQLFMDPSDRAVAAGFLPPHLEGVRCLLLDRGKARWATVPETPGEASARVATLELTVAPSGEVSGRGRLSLTGHHAWERIGWKPTREKTLQAWVDWLHDRLPDYDARDVEVVERADDRGVEVAWHLRQRPEETLGTEATIAVAAPLQQRLNPFTLPPDRRLTPVQIAFRDSDQVAITISVPAGWRVASRPRLRTLANDVGRLATALEVDEAGRRIRLTRRLDTFMTEVGGGDYAALRALQEAAVASDAEVLVLASP